MAVNVTMADPRRSRVCASACYQFQDVMARESGPPSLGRIVGDTSRMKDSALPICCAPRLRRLGGPLSRAMTWKGEAMEKVLCVCVGNISRSPMMQAVLQHHLGAAFRVESAGLTKELAGRPANFRSVACMEERGADLSGHVSRWIGDLDLDEYRWIVCVGHDEAEQVRPALGWGSARVMVANEHHGGIPDPYDLGMDGYRACLALLDEVMPNIAQRITAGRHR
jgi:protein-tyrosine phosphatase